MTSCKPTETFNEDAGSPADGWEWDELKGQGSISFKSANKVKFIQIGTVLPGANPANPNNPAGDVVDLVIQMKLKGVIADDSPAGASGTGTLATLARATLDDRVGGDMTVFDFPAAFPFDLTAGQAKLKTSAAALLNSIGQKGLPPCTSHRGGGHQRSRRELDQVRPPRQLHDPVVHAAFIGTLEMIPKPSARRRGGWLWHI